MGVETLPSSISSTAINSAVSAVEGPATVQITSISPEITGGVARSGFSLSDLQSLPELKVDISSINLDRQVPVGEMVFNEKLFGTVAKPSPVTQIETISQLKTKVETISPIIDITPILHEPKPRVQPSFHPRGGNEATPADIFLVQKAPGANALEKPETTTQIIETRNAIKVDVISPIIPEIVEATGKPEAVAETLETEEIKADANAIVETIIKVKENPVFTSEEKDFWIVKFHQLAEEKNALVAVETKTELKVGAQTEVQTPIDIQIVTQTETEPQTKSATQTENTSIPPQKPPEIAVKLEEPATEPDPPAEKLEWDLYVVETTKKTAEESLKKRLRIAKGIVYEPESRDNLTTRTVAQSESFKLDVPDATETVNILTGQLEYPPIADKVQISVEAVNENDLPAVQKAVTGVIVDNKPRERSKNPSYLGRIDQENLPSPAQILAKRGAKKIIFRQARTWQEANRLKLEEPIEMEKVEK